MAEESVFCECPHLGVPVELTAERQLHIAAVHPSLLPEHIDRVIETLREPDFVGSRAGRGERGFCRYWQDVEGGRSIVVVVVGSPHSGTGAMRYWVVTAYIAREYSDVGSTVTEQLTFMYDRQGDILYVNFVPPYAGQESDEIGDGVIARMNPRTGAVENLEILFFSSRFERLGDLLHLPVTTQSSPPLAG